MVKRFALIISWVLILSTIGGVYATWNYATYPIQSVHQNLGVTLSEFHYPPEEILPGGDNDSEVELGGNHYTVVKLIVDEAGRGYSLNDANSIIHSLLESYDSIYSNQKISGGNLKFILDPKNNTHKLYYAMERISEDIYYIYTYSIDDLATVGGTDLELPVYRTEVNKIDGTWTLYDSHIGYAKSVELSSLGFSSMSQTLNYVIDVSSWRHE
ncbi:MAG: hypothetical protein IJ004_01085 [Clostridia bacterium]|nr:hypothetical protein [Clostridia bacterium]